MLFKTVSRMKLIMKEIPATGKNHTATVIFFHGSGDNGNNMVESIRFLLGRDIRFPHIKFLFPTAPTQPYTPLDSQLSNVWFDRRSISIEAKESRKSLAVIYEAVNDLIESETQNGIAANRIVLGGFSMGGCLAMHAGYHLNTDLGGVFACSSFLNRGSIVYESLNNKKNPECPLPELLMFHGDRDSLVPLAWGVETFEELKKLGVHGHFNTLPNTLHELKKKELLDLQDWLEKVLPHDEAHRTKL